ncbi:MAG: zf-HC2 domain-containing protein [Candidatus Acetothermia bacterium]|jgi:anti-sigma factor RsiW|nr:zf-HC2 domain-containing protein [Candidatus Acetothermia bacterium]MDH7504960.1 zf-HC2 domain-containing protein [Candidatus Acetothermia bacterium]
MRLGLRSCRKIRKLLPWYVNGTLVGEELAGVEGHLRRCRRCLAEVEDLRRLQAGLVQALEEAGPADAEGLLDKTLALIEAEEKLEEQLLRLLALPRAERRELGRLSLGLFVLGFSLGMAYERGRLPFEAELSALGLPLAKFKGRI